MLKICRGNCATGKLSMYLENYILWNERLIGIAPCEARGHALSGSKIVVRNSQNQLLSTASKNWLTNVKTQIKNGIDVQCVIDASAQVED